MMLKEGLTQRQKVDLKASLCKRFNKYKENENAKLFSLIIETNKKRNSIESVETFKRKSRQRVNANLIAFAKELTKETPIHYKSILTITNTII